MNGVSSGSRGVFVCLDLCVGTFDTIMRLIFYLGIRLNVGFFQTLALIIHVQASRFYVVSS